MPEQDFRDFIDRHTLVLHNVPVYRKGEATDQFEDWTIPPLSAEGELTIREHQKKSKDNEDVATMSDFWAPIVATMVKTPTLSVEDLKQYPSQLLREIGRMGMRFFRSGKIEEKREPKEES